MRKRTKATQARPKGAKNMIEGDTPRAMDAQEAYAKTENVKEWLERFAETGDAKDFDKLLEKYRELGKMVEGLEQWVSIV